ncbi:unnamed protein product, partial [Pleuronectes platessa]
MASSRTVSPSLQLLTAPDSSQQPPGGAQQQEALSSRRRSAAGGAQHQEALSSSILPRAIVLVDSDRVEDAEGHWTRQTVLWILRQSQKGGLILLRQEACEVTYEDTNPVEMSPTSLSLRT